LPRVSVIIPMLNEQSNIGLLLDLLRKQTQLPDEIIVVDGGSSDTSVDIASNFEEVRIVNASPPVGAQRQKGLEIATGDIVVFLDSDTQPDEHFIEKALSEFTRRKADIACPLFVPTGVNFAVSLLYWFYNLVFIATQQILPSGAGMCIIAKRDFAIGCGGLRKELVYEDIEFIRRCGKKGRYRILPVKLYVSGRRFKQHGAIIMAFKYLALSFFFTLGIFKFAEIIKYPFGKYEQGRDEYVVLVDDGGETIGYELKSRVHNNNTRLHKAFSVFLFDSAGHVMLQQRSAKKKTWPLVWSNSCCGHLLPGETVEQAARRRLKEELGIDNVRLAIVIPDFRYFAQMNGVAESEICPVLIGYSDDKVIPNPDEVQEIKWVTWDELYGICVDPASEISPWCIEEVKLLNKLLKDWESEERFRQIASNKPLGDS